jgi:hypothetical protein
MSILQATLVVALTVHTLLRSSGIRTSIPATMVHNTKIDTSSYTCTEVELC